MLEKGLCLAIGDGCTAKFWKDPWIPYLKGFKLSSEAPTEVVEDALVGEFIFNNSWELSSTDLWLTNDEIESIKKTHIPLRSKPDSWKWVYSSNGDYSVKTGYIEAKKLLARDAPDAPSSSSSVPVGVWKMIWNLKVPNKVKHFLWRACSNSLPTKEQLWKRKCSPSQVCPCCSSCDETKEHMLLLCTGAKVVWFCGPLSLRLDDFSVSRFDSWCYDMLSNSHMFDFSKALVGFTCWAIWKNKCSLVFDRKPFMPVDIMCAVSRDLYEFWGANKWSSQSTENYIDQVPLETSWMLPPSGSIKINVDGSMDSMGKEKIGIILRGSDGAMLYGFAKKVNASSPLMTEVIALKQGIQIAKALDISSSFFSLIIYL